MTIASTILADSPQLYWKLDDGAGPAASDSSGNGHPGVYSGNFALGVPGPEVGTTACRLGSGAQVQGGAVTPVLVRPWSIEIWFALIQQMSTNQTLNANQSTGVGAGALFEQTGQVNSVSVIRQNVGFSSSAGLFVDAAWHQFVWTFDNSNNVLMYDNGVLVLTQGSQTMNNCTSASRFQVGQTSAGAPFYVAHAALFSSILTITQINNHLAGRTAPQAPQSVSAVGSADLTTVTGDLTTVNSKLDQILAAVRKTFPTT